MGKLEDHGAWTSSQDAKVWSMPKGSVWKDCPCGRSSLEPLCPKCRAPKEK